MVLWFMTVDASHTVLWRLFSGSELHFQLVELLSSLLVSTRLCLTVICVFVFQYCIVLQDCAKYSLPIVYMIYSATLYFRQPAMKVLYMNFYLSVELVLSFRGLCVQPPSPMKLITVFKV